MRVQIAFSFCRAAKENRSHARCHSGYNYLDGGADELHCVKDSHSRSNRAPWGINVEGDFLSWFGGLQEEKLFRQISCRSIAYFSPQKYLSFLKKLALNHFGDGITLFVFVFAHKNICIYSREINWKSRASQCVSNACPLQRSHSTRRPRSQVRVPSKFVFGRGKARSHRYVPWLTWQSQRTNKGHT